MSWGAKFDEPKVHRFCRYNRLQKPISRRVWITASEKSFCFARKVLVQCELLSTRAINIYRSGFLCCTSTRSLTLLEHRHLEQSPQLPVSRLFPNFCFSLQGLLGRKIMFSVATDTIYTLVKAVLSKFSVACWQSYSPDTATLPSIQYVPGTWYLVPRTRSWCLVPPGTLTHRLTWPWCISWYNYVYVYVYVYLVRTCVPTSRHLGCPWTNYAYTCYLLYMLHDTYHYSTGSTFTVTYLSIWQ